MRRLRLVETALAIGVLALAVPSLCKANPGLPPNAPARIELTLDGYTILTPSGSALYYDDSVQLRSRGGVGPCPDKPTIMSDDMQSGMGARPVLGAKFVKSCTQKWHPFLADAGAQPVGDFTLVDRPEGKQWAWMGRPLFMSIKDKKPGDRYGGFPGGYGRTVNPMVLAKVPEEFPAGLRISLRDEGLVIATANGKAVYTPKKGSRPDDRFLPVMAPAMAAVGGAWSIINAGTERAQYAFNGKPLYALSSQDSELDVEATGGWETVVYYPAPRRPADIGRQLTLDGEVYTDKDGHTLYTYTCNTASPGAKTLGVSCDDPGDPAAFWVALCGSPEECAQRWKPYVAREGSKPAGLWSVVDATYPVFTDLHGVIFPPDAPRVKVWAYRGKPLFITSDDKKPGDLRGDKTAGLWGGGALAMLHVPGHEITE